jgi:hypothetical protein
MRSANSVLLTALVALGACSDATGSLQGGGALPLPSVASSGTGANSGSSSGASGTASSGTTAGTPTWGYIYATYMAAPAPNGCGNTATICHATATDTGPTQTPPKSGFVCGTSSHACYQGLLNATPPLIGPSFTANPTMAPLYQALYTGGRPGLTSDNMPYLLTSHFVASDLALFSQWIQNGAQETP